MSAQTSVARAYRNVAVLVRRLPPSDRPRAWEELRDGFRRNAAASGAEVPALLDEAEKKAAFLRMVTPRPLGGGGGGGPPQRGSVTYVYKAGGEVEEGGKGTVVEKAPVSNWDGKNMDPCQVKRHYAGLKRAGFANNQHAKGLF